jgi:hypothetical protein
MEKNYSNMGVSLRLDDQFYPYVSKVKIAGWQQHILFFFVGCCLLWVIVSLLLPRKSKSKQSKELSGKIDT